MKPLFIVVMTLLITCGSAYAQSATNKDQSAHQTSTTKEEDIQRLLEIVGVNKLGHQFWSQMFPLLKQSAPQVPEREWREIDKEFSAEFTSGKYLELIASIYSAHFTQEEVRELIAFYESPIGKKVTSVMPQLAQEAMVAGQERGKEIMKRVYEKLRKKGYSVPTA